jgi:hypothetical protein
MKAAAIRLGAAPLPRRDLVAVFAYIGRQRGPARCVDGSFEGPDAFLDRLAAAARMQ